MALPKVLNLYRLTRDPEVRTSQAGMVICKVGLACSEKYGERETQLFIDGTAFKKTAEMLATVQKGQRVFAFGKLKTDKWQDKETGQTRSKISMIIESFEFIEPKQDNQVYQQQNNRGGFQAPQQHTGSQQGFHQQPQPNQGLQNQQQYPEF